MAGFELDYYQNHTSASHIANLIEPATKSALLGVLDEAVAYYSRRLINLSPNDFKSPEEFARKWQFLKGALEAVDDIKLTFKGYENDNRISE